MAIFIFSHPTTAVGVGKLSTSLSSAGPVESRGDCAVPLLPATAFGGLVWVECGGRLDVVYSCPLPTLT
ncbi:hypothetical protein DIJ64_02230 [Mycobacterium leprae]|nr:hypothetical protein [Mycobacterium leprae]AWV47339.1 hypothetical protein DIJ64_02230 [Mycobacterium leprae]OAR20595.1 hypothetical protein A8144_10170 [Mycobacterium leprae 3125609]OAX70793.1 hypothetical protein A3216_09895 [Mycobacterium leprae 7935681]